MSVFYIKQNDTKPSIVAQLFQDSSPVDLTDATVKFHMETTINAAAVVVDAATGTVRYDWEPGDTATAGTFRAEFEVTFNDGSVETFPNNDYLTIVVKQELA